MKLPSLSFLAQAFLAALRRFPLTMTCAAIGVAVLMAAIEHDSGNKDWIKVWMMAQLGLALCTGLTVFAESEKWSSVRKAALEVAGLGLLVVYYFWLDLEARNPDTIQLPRYLAFLAVVHLFVAVAPYLNRLSVADFWEYNKQLFANFIVGAAYTLILFSGLALALLAVNELFDLGIREKMYAHLFVLLAGIFNTAFFLYHFPAEFVFTDREKSYNVVFKNLCQYILIPIVGLYFLILYAYSVKILVTWSLPHGWVSSLVLGFSVAGIFTYLINYLLPEYTESKIVYAYRRWFWWVLLPMVGLLFVAIGRRIADYGVTEPRFYVAHAGVWLLLVCAYFLWSKTDNIKFIPISLGLFILIAVLGPFSAYQVAERSQAAILHRLFEENGRFGGDKLKPGGEQVAGEAADQISSVLYFLERHDALDRVEPWLPMPWQALPGWEGANNRVTQLTDWLNIKSGTAAGDWNRKRSIYPNEPAYYGNVAGYRAFYRLELYEVNLAEKRRPAEKYTWLSADGTQLLVQPEGTKSPADTFDLVPLMRRWIAADSAAGADLRLDTGYVDLRGKKLNARLYLQEARFDRRNLAMESLYGMLFVK